MYDRGSTVASTLRLCSLFNQTSRPLIWLPLITGHPAASCTQQSVISLLQTKAISIQRPHKLYNHIKAKGVILQDDVRNIVPWEVSQLCAALVCLQEGLCLFYSARMDHAGIIISVMDDCVIRN